MTVVRAHARRGSHGVRTHLRRHVSVSEQSYDLRAKGVESDLSDTERSDLNAAILVLDREAHNTPAGSEHETEMEDAKSFLYIILQRGYL